MSRRAVSNQSWLPGLDNGLMPRGTVRPGGVVVNVASVPQRSPFRYAGGKTWLVPEARRWLASQARRPKLLVEAFAGGASVGLAAGIEGLVDRVMLVELDADVASVWKAIFGGEGAALAERVSRFVVTRGAVESVIDSQPQSELDRAFRTLVRNRMLHGGILAPGASLMREGENGKGLLSRWYPATLVRRILALAEHADRFEVVCADGLEVIAAEGRHAGTCVFADPPYVVAGRRLYTHHELDHRRLFERCARVRGDFLMTYDHAPEIVSLSREFGLDTALVPMKSRQHAIKLELLVGRDLRWARAQALR